MKKDVLIFTLIISFLVALVGMHAGSILDAHPASVHEQINALETTLFWDVFYNPFGLTFSTTSLLGGFMGFLLAWIIWAAIFAMPKQTRPGTEHGSARWADPKEISAFMDSKDKDNNLLLTQHSGLALSRKKFDQRYDRNLNILVVGGSGAGKTRYYVKPNLLQFNSNYLLTDPKGTTLLDCGHAFVANGYDIRCLNTIDFAASNQINPLWYVHSDADILSFVNCLIANTDGDEQTSQDPFWPKAERLLFVSLIAFLRDWMPRYEFNLPNLFYLLSLAKASEQDENFKSPLDVLFEQIETGKIWVNDDIDTDNNLPHMRVARNNAHSQSTGRFVPSTLVRRDGYMPGKSGGLAPSDDFALSNYNAFKVAAGETLKSIIIGCNTRLASLGIAELSDLLYGKQDFDDKDNPTDTCGADELELDKLGDKDRKIIVFLIMSDTDRTFSFLSAILMWQTVNLLCNKALIEYGGRLPRLVNLIFDEFANIGKLPDFDQVVAVTRSRNIGVSIILQSISQLKARYGEDKAKVIQDCCDTLLFLGGKSNATNKEISDAIGNETINTLSFTTTHGQSASRTKQYNKQSRALIDPAEVGKLPRDQALVLIAGANPYKDKKYKLESHPRYPLIDPGHKPYKRKRAKYSTSFDFKTYMKGRIMES